MRFYQVKPNQRYYMFLDEAVYECQIKKVVYLLNKQRILVTLADKGDYWIEQHTYNLEAISDAEKQRNMLYKTLKDAIDDKSLQIKETTFHGLVKKQGYTTCNIPLYRCVEEGAIVYYWDGRKAVKTAIRFCFIVIEHTTEGITLIGKDDCHNEHELCNRTLYATADECIKHNKVIIHKLTDKLQVPNKC